ncbi:hypothetical protein EC968_003530 [Mortierella alpina]|nr:hypothetical protein EC968_003530 [Mortierella alpina]
MKLSFTITAAIALLFSSSASSAPVDPSDNLLRIPISRLEKGSFRSTAQELRYILNKYDAEDNLQADDVELAKLPLTDAPMDSRYYGTVLIGTPGQPLELLIDTGSSPLVISAAGCGTCSGDGRYDNSTSSSFIPADGSHWSLGYQDGSKTEGTNGFDSVTIGSKTAKNQVLFVATTMSPNFDGIVDGILGMSFGALTGTPTVFESMVAQKVVSKSVFSVFLGHETTGGGGEVVLGGIDQDRIAEGDEITYTNVTEARYWKINVQDVLVDDVSAEALDGNPGYPAIVDTGANLIVLPGNLPEQVNSKIQGSRKFGTVWTVPCKGTSNLKFQIGGQTFLVPAADLAREVAVERLDLCHSAVQQNTKNEMILGDTFIKNHYVVFDQQEKRVGFAPLRT